MRLIMNIPRVAAVAAAFALLGFGGSAYATPQPDVVKTQVRFADLDLHTPDGNVVLYHRLSSAARRVCEESTDQDMALFDAEMKCRAEAMQAAVAQVNSPILTALYQENDGKNVVAMRMAQR
jgi:UrcA family protein